MKTTGNNFERKKIDGEETWFWEDEAGSMCGRKRKWRYKVQAGDSYKEAGMCPQGYKHYEIEIRGTPERVT